MFKEHRTLVDVRRLEPGGQGNFDTGQIEREANGVDHVTGEYLVIAGLSVEGQSQDRGISGNDAQAVPERKAELRAHRLGREMIFKQREGCGRELHPGFGEERIKFRLHLECLSAKQAGQ